MSETAQGAGTSPTPFKVKNLKTQPPNWFFDPDNPFGQPKKKLDYPIAKLVPLTKEQWEAMNEKARWDTIVALRGPDLVNSNGVKWLTSSVIRWKMSEITNTHGLVNERLPFVVLPSDLPRGNGSFDFNHFCGHIYEASYHLGIPVCYVPWAAWKKATAAGGIGGSNALVTLLPFLSGSFKDWVCAYLTNQYGYSAEQLTALSIPDQKEEAPPCE